MKKPERPTIAQEIKQAQIVHAKITLSARVQWAFRRWMVAVWAMVAASVLIIIGMVNGYIHTSFGVPLSLLIGIAGAYMTASAILTGNRKEEQ